MIQPKRIIKRRVLHIIAVLLPSVLTLNAGYFLLLGLTLSTLLAWISLSWTNDDWKGVGLVLPKNPYSLIFSVVPFTILLLLISYYLKEIIVDFVGMEPNLDEFDVLEGNFKLFAISIVIAWLFGALFEELLFRGYIMNSIVKLMVKDEESQNIHWGISLIVTSLFSGVGHYYQGPTGMILAMIIAFGFGTIYLMFRKILYSSILAHGVYDTVALTFVYLGLDVGSMF